MIYGPRQVSVRQIYLLTAATGVFGFALLAAVQGIRQGIAFALGALVSIGNLWLFAWLAAAIEPGEKVRKPWQASAFMSRYLILFAAGYAIVRALGVSPLPVVLGLFASTVAVLLSSVVELVASLFKSRRA
jgi:succinate-acetate transporter protein